LIRHQNRIEISECEHVIGTLLTHRNELINYGQISKENIYAGMVIGRAFVGDPDRLNDEFDALTMYYVWNTLHGLGVNENTFTKAAILVFDNFDITPEVRDYYGKRIGEYDGLSDLQVGIRLLNNVALIYAGNVEKNEPKILGKQLSEFKKRIEHIINKELSASGTTSESI
jgi:hypothetical protein